MSHRKQLAFASLGLILLQIAGPARATGNAEEHLARPCFECHGQDGISVKPAVPNINGQLQRYLFNTLKKFKSSERPSLNPLLNTKAELLKDAPDKDILAIARYFSRLNKEQPPQAFDAEKAEIGRRLHEEHCEACHNWNGRESTHNAPYLAGQRLDYLQFQSRAFMNGLRPVPYMMDESIKGLTADDMEPLAHFYASQPRVLKH